MANEDMNALIRYAFGKGPQAEVEAQERKANLLSQLPMIEKLETRLRLEEITLEREELAEKRKEIGQRRQEADEAARQASEIRVPQKLPST